MPIEFSCPSCRKLLSTRDNKAGRTAKYPDCAEPISVPADMLKKRSNGGAYDQMSGHRRAAM